MNSQPTNPDRSDGSTDPGGEARTDPPEDGSGPIEADELAATDVDETSAVDPREAKSDTAEDVAAPERARYSGDADSDDADSDHADSEHADSGDTDSDHADSDDTDSDDTEPAAGRRRTSRAKLSTPAALAVGLVCLLLGIGLVVQVRLADDDDPNLRGASQEDLVRILDELDARDQQLREEIDELQATRDDLESGGDAAVVAQQEAQKRADQLAILVGTVPATGPGIIVTISDPLGTVPPEAILDVIQELRASGAEAIQIGDVRIGTTSAVGGAPGKVTIDGKSLSRPIEVRAIGDPATMSAAMGIPGGIVATIRYYQGEATVETAESIDITALRELDEPDYAQPAAPTS